MGPVGDGVAEAGEDNPFAYAEESVRRGTLDLVARALVRNDAFLVFQPVVQSRQPGEVAFYEALIRLRDERGHVIPAGDFIGAVESTELGRAIDCLALDQGLLALSEAPGLRLSINMSARSIGYPHWTETLRRRLAADPTLGERLILEITESSAMAIPEITAPFMRALQSDGVAFALDDFGSGRTSFRYLRDFFFDAIKIDGQYIRGIRDNADNQCLTRALQSIAEHFDMFTVAECVETAEDAAFLTEMGIDCQQGYAHGYPSAERPWLEGAARVRKLAG